MVPTDPDALDAATISRKRLTIEEQRRRMELDTAEHLP